VVNLHFALARRTATLAAAGLVVAAPGLASCGVDGAPSAERFCGEVSANKDALTNPEVVYSDDIEPLLELYRDIGELAPLGVESDWNQLVSAYETASTVVIGDEESEQAALTAIFSSERSAAAVETWLLANCAVDIGPVVTIVPHGPSTAVVAPSDPATPPSTP
jgi:hypothetical protein